MSIAHLILIALLLATFSAVAADPAKPGLEAAGKPAEYTVGELRTFTLPAMTYLYGGSNTTFDKIMDVIGKWLPPAMKALQEKQAVSAGSAMFVYRNMTGLDKPFDLEIGWMVAEGTKAVGELKVRKTEPLKCAGAIYNGPITKLGDAYGKIMGDVTAQKLEPSGESREIYLYWEGEASTNNVVWILIGVK